MNIQGIISKFLLFIFVLISFSAYSEEINLSFRNGTVYLDINLENDEKIYWRHHGDIGMPTKLLFSGSVNLDDRLINWPWPKFIKTETGNNVAIYDHRISIPVYLKAISPDQPINLSLTVKYLLCSDVCSLKEKNFKLDVKPPFYWLRNLSDPPRGTISLKDTLRYKFKTVVPEDSLELVMVDEKTNKIFFPDELKKIGEKYYIANFKLDDFKNKTDNFNIRIYSNFNPNYAKYNLKLGDILAKPEISPIILFLIVGFIGGFILNFMPCVLPVLSIKLYNFIHGYTPTERRKHCMVAIFTIICYFFLIATLTVTAKKAGGYFVPGLTLQNPFFVVFVAVLLTVLVSAIEGNIVISLPKFILRTVSGASHANKYAETFLVTVVSTILATPCTAPFLGSSITFAISTSSINIYLIFLFISMGFSVPYFLVIVNPSIVNIFPKPGKWQIFIKRFFAVLILLTMCWLLIILNTQVGLALTLAVLLLCALIKFILDKAVMDFYKIFTISSFILLIVAFQALMKEDLDILSKQKNAHWERFIPEQLDNYITQDQIVLVNITAEWCITCKFLKSFVLDSKKSSSLLRKYHVTSLTGDITNFNPSIQEFLNQNHASGIPYNVIYGPKAREGIVLPSIFTYSDLEEAIKNAW